ncbi:hypothetical protein KC19_7G078500 [Ceratodon purpureus]|nr:hypothetical protein KC19_7G078500 [Ceratodon purpureus]
MLLNRLNISSATSTLRGTSDGFVVRQRGRFSSEPKLLQVRAAISDSGAGWFESKVGKVGSYVDKKSHTGHGNEDGEEMVHFKGTAVIIKKLKVLDVVDRIADIQDDASEILGGKHVSVQLISNEFHPKTGKVLVSSEVNIEGWFTIFDPWTAEELSFHLDFAVPRAFGVPGAIIVKNNHPNEFLLVNFSLDLPDKSSAHFITNSWVFNTEHTDGRVFFRNKAYLPSDTPAALQGLRERELQVLRGNGNGERKHGERIYDYDVYNDLGLPDDGPKHARPTLGGSLEFPFPRRMRTGRPPTKTSPDCESRRSKPFYVPSDERFDHVKLSDNKADMVRAGGHAISSKIEAKLMRKADFDSIEEIWKLYAPKEKDIKNVLPGKVDIEYRDQHSLAFVQELTARRADGEKNHPLRFALPQVLQANDKAWQTNEEFAREFLAGFNPIEIKLVTEFPIKSSLNPAEYGDPVSAISSKHIDGHLEGLSIEEALSKKKLFVVDYHDTFFPWVGRINALENSKTYASRTLFFLSSDETLKVLAIELVLPPKSPDGAKIARVFTPPADSSKTNYVWELAKAHAINNEMAVHQSINHFTRCHAVTEPIIIASHRQLSKLHPIHQLMAPHFKHTLEVNSTARMNLLPAGGTIEEIYTPREYIVRMAAAYYRDNWTFSSNALPNDLVKR